MSRDIKRFERRIAVAAVLDMIVLLAGAWMYIETGNIAWIVGAFVLGWIPPLYVVLSNLRSQRARSTPSSANSLVQDSRERR